MPQNFSQDFSNQNLQGRSFQGQNLAGANFSRSNIQGVNFANAVLTNANFSYAQAGLSNRSAIKIVIVSLFLAILSSFFSGTTGTMELAVLEIGKMTAISASWIVLTVLPVFSFFTIRDGLGAALRKVAIAIALAMTLPVMLAWIGLIRGSLTGATTGILPGIMVSGGIIVGAGVLALAIAMAGLVSPAAALCVGAVGALFVAASTTGAIGFIAMIVTTAKGTPIEDLSADVVSGNRSAPELDVAVQIVAGSVGFAGATVLMGSLVVAGLGIYLGWRILAEDEKYANLRQIAVNFAAIGGTNFHKADLTDANFTQAFLKGTDFREAILIRTCWFQCQKLPFTRLDNTYLKNNHLRKLITTKEGRNQKLDGQNLQGANLQGSNLIGASFINTDLSHANLRQADLSRAKLVRSQLEHADLTGAILTGACIENWIISRTTKLDAVECDYIYMRQDTNDNPNPNRIPTQGNFQKNEFISFIQSLLDTLDLYHDLLNPLAAVTVLKKLSEKYQETLQIVGLEKRGNGIIIKLKTSKSINHEVLRQEYYAEYEEVLKQPLANRPSSLDYDFIKAKVSELSNLVEEIKRHPTTTIKYLYSEGIVITGGDVNLNVDQTVSQGVDRLSTDRTIIGFDDLYQEVSNAINQIGNFRQFSVNYITVLRKLAEALATEPNLEPEDKVEALEQLEVFIAVWRNPKSVEMQKNVNIAIKFFKGLALEFPNARIFGEASDRLLPALATLLSK